MQLIPACDMALFQVGEIPKHNWQEEFQNQQSQAIE